jgi:serine protease Do
MSEPDFEQTGFDENETPAAPQDTLSEDGEYPFTRDRIYADAHYEPAGASTEPPRYYTPPERPVKEAKPPRERAKSLVPAALCLALSCTLLGGLLGAGLARWQGEQRLDALENRLQAQMQTNAASVSEELDSIRAVMSAPVYTEGGLNGAQIFEQAKHQVVGISTEITYQNFFGMTSSSAVSGSGFIISEDGYIITNYHVVETAYLNGLDVRVMLYDGTQYSAAIVGFDDGSDVAILKIEAENLHAVTFGDSNGLTVGETIYCVGNPLGELAYSMSTGTVSGLDRVIKTEEAVGGINMFQLDAAVNHGNSGGPVYNSRGEVVGIVTAKSGATDAEGLGFAIPINDAAVIAEDVMTVGYVTGRAYLGVRLDDRYNSMYASYYNMPLGAYVYSVNADSPAERSGIQTGDIITAIDDTPIGSYSELKSVLRSYSAGETAQITVYRAGQVLTLELTFDEVRPAGVGDNPNTVLDPQASNLS